MELTNEKIVNLYVNLEEILENDYDHAWNFNLTQARNKRNLEPIAQDIVQEQRNIQLEYGDVDDNGNMSFDNFEDQKEAQDAIDDLKTRTQEVQLEKVHQDDVPKSLSGNQLAAIMEVIENG